jgi:hypothetical protein
MWFSLFGFKNSQKLHIAYTNMGHDFLNSINIWITTILPPLWHILCQFYYIHSCQKGKILVFLGNFNDERFWGTNIWEFLYNLCMVVLEQWNLQNLLYVHPLTIMNTISKTTRNITTSFPSLTTSHPFFWFANINMKNKLTCCAFSCPW